MEIRDFALTVLRSPHLDDKLRPPPAFTDARPGGAPVPEAPARTGALKLHSDAQRPPFPAPGTLHRVEQRAAALHTFANHELMALELMALALLRFPDADPEFRADVARTMRDEQVHCRLYVKRLEGLGIGFGELPLSSFFWDALSGMHTPTDYVTWLSMTFEQANLDFAVAYRDLFAAVDDAASARVLERVHADEVRHLATGVRWFERWREPGPSLWQAWSTALPEALPRAYARGLGFQRQDRLDAGLDEDFADRIARVPHRRGRPARFLLPNAPRAELDEVGASVGDLCASSLLLAGSQDILIGPPPPAPFVELLFGLDIEPAQVVPWGELDELLSTVHHALGYEPWRWDDDARRLRGRIGERIPGSQPPPPLPDAAPPPGGIQITSVLHTDTTPRRPVLVRRLDTAAPCWTVNKPWAGLDVERRRALHAPSGGPSVVTRIARAVHAARGQLRAANYRGPASLRLGVDGSTLHVGAPTPGWSLPTLAAALSDLVPAHREAVWLHLGPAWLDAAGLADADAARALLADRLPLQTVSTGARRQVVSGALPTSPWQGRYLSALLVAPRARDLLDALPEPWR